MWYITIQVWEWLYIINYSSFKIVRYYLINTYQYFKNIIVIIDVKIIYEYEYMNKILKFTEIISL